MEECRVCLLDIENENVKIITICNHKFHKNCLFTWLNRSADKSCPLCRTTLPNDCGELITYWDNINWIMKTYKYGNIERAYYHTGYLKYEFILSVEDDSEIIRSILISEDGSAKYTINDFTPEQINGLRRGENILIPNRIINYQFDTLFTNDILNIIQNSLEEIPALEPI